MFFLAFTFYLFIYLILGGTHVPHHSCGYVAGVSSLLPCGFSGLNSPCAALLLEP